MRNLPSTSSILCTLFEEPFQHLILLALIVLHRNHTFFVHAFRDTYLTNHSLRVRLQIRHNSVTISHHPNDANHIDLYALYYQRAFSNPSSKQTTRCVAPHTTSATRIATWPSPQANHPTSPKTSTSTSSPRKQTKHTSTHPLPTSQHASIAPPTTGANRAQLPPAATLSRLHTRTSRIPTAMAARRAIILRSICAVRPSLRIGKPDSRIERHMQRRCA